MKKPFKNRRIHENKKTINKLKKLDIKLESDEKMKPYTIYGLFAVTIHPNKKTDAIILEQDHKHVLCLYYHWMYGSKWYKIPITQRPWNGIIEEQIGEHNHIHTTVYEPNIEEFSIFINFIKGCLKTKYPKIDIECRQIYD